MCINKNYKRTVKRIVESEKNFIFFILTKFENADNRCYVCDKELNANNVNFLNIPTENKTIFLCKHCMKRFNSQRKINEEIFFENVNNIEKLKNNDIKLIPFMNEGVLKISFAHKIWLDSQRRKHEERRNKNKS